jgi:replicative DNA helicase
MSNSKFNIDSGFISKLLQTRDMSAVEDNRIRVDYLAGEARAAFKFIQESVSSTGEVPTIRVFERKFPHFALESVEDNRGVERVGTEEGMKFWCDELRHRKKHNTLADSIEEVSGLMKNLDTDEAYKLLKSAIVYVETEVEETSDVDITKDVDKRIQAYLDRKKNKGMRGLATGFPLLDYILKGLEKKTLTTLIANTGVGKTWFEVLLGAYCQLQNCRVLQFVTEMSEEVMRDRYEAVLFSKCYKGGFNYNAFKSGTLDLKTEKKFFQFLHDDLPDLEPLFICTATGVMSVAASIDKYKPDLVMIDGAYLMEDDQGAKDDWLRVAHITRDLKRLAKSMKVPILINTQADKNTSKKTGPELGSIMYTQAVGQDSDNVIALFRDEVMMQDKEMGIKVLKQREGTLGKVFTSWDFDTMNFECIYTEGSSNEDEEKAEVEEDEDDS